MRAPEGITGETFFQKHIAANVKGSPLRHSVPGKDHDVIAVENLADLIALVQSGALEIHVRGSRLDSLETCDRIVFDLDPGEDVTWKDIVAAARETRERLKDLKLRKLRETVGRQGHSHWGLPIADAGWDTAKDFAQKIAFAMAADSPRLYLAKMTKSLRKGRIFIDYFRNSREADFGGRVLDPRAAGRADLRAAIMGAIGPHERGQSVHGTESRKNSFARTHGATSAR